MGLLAPIIVAIVLVVGVGSYYKGRESRSDEIAELTAAIETSRKLAEEAEARANAASARVVVEYRDRIKVIREAAPPPEIIEVIKRETPADCRAPGAFRVLHDAAAAGSAIPEAPGGTDAAPAEIEAIARTVAENYRIANENAARLEALQSWINSQ